MKKLAGILASLILAVPLLAQTNGAVKLALISETDEAATAADILTAQLTGNSRIQLLERDEIQKVYREQGMSAANRDDLKLGRILGADGLLLLNVVRTPQATNLMTRLIAVKPGVILTDGSFPWPLKDSATWADLAATGINSFLPRLALLAKDAIPISVVNLRSAISSSEAAETERELKLLTIQRLSQEPQFFILERQKMQRLGEEKELAADDSAFWNGNYLLEGVVDQNGYSPDIITINAQLTPPKGAPMLFEVTGSRTNLSEVVNRLAGKVAELLKVNSTVKGWSAADEAAQYFNEAKWALKWGIYSEAEAAADSAWALGKQDLDCALVRVKAYCAELTVLTGAYQGGSDGIATATDVNGRPQGPMPTDAQGQLIIKQLLAEHPLGLKYRITKCPTAIIIDYVFANTAPDARNIERASHLLDLYYTYARNHPEAAPKAASADTNWPNWRISEWDEMGIKVLVAAAKVLQNFDFLPTSQVPVAGQLASLRAQARSLAEFISTTPSVHDSYFVGNRIATADELTYTIEENPTIFRCKAIWGCYWQETPEDGVALYRELMSSPVFRYVHSDFWMRDVQTPRLVAWNDSDRQRIPMVWNNFLRELNGSTNILLRLEAEALELADADSEAKVATAFTNLFNGVFQNEAALIDNNVEVIHVDWGLGDLVYSKTDSGLVTQIKESLDHIYRAEYFPRLEAMDQEYWNKTVPAATFAPIFEKQKQYFKENTAYDFIGWFNLFAGIDNAQYSRSQALEILPLIIAYKSNLVAQSQNVSNRQRGRFLGAIAEVGFLEGDVNRILTPQTPQPPSEPAVQPPNAVAVSKVVAPAPAAAGAPDVATNIMSVSHFLAIPLDGLQGDKISNVKITAHHWFEGKLLLNFEYDAFVYTFDQKGNWTSSAQISFGAIAILDPATETWNVVPCSEVHIGSQNNSYQRSVLLNGDVFNCDGGQIRKYDFIHRRWEVLKVSDGNDYGLFPVNGHLYAANGNIIFEITDGGNGTRILASTRRRPPVTVLDSPDLGMVALFEGPQHSLRASAGAKIYTWTGDDWREEFVTPPASFPPEMFPEGVLFRHAADYLDQPMSLSCLSAEGSQAELYLRQEARRPGIVDSSYRMRTHAPGPGPVWQMPTNLFLANLPAAIHKSDLYLLADHSQEQDVVDERQHMIVGKKFLPRNGYQAVLLCFSRGVPDPQRLYLTFDAPDSCPPLTGGDPGASQYFAVMPSGWMLFSDGGLFFGLEDPRDAIPIGRPLQTGVGGKVGVWFIPVVQIDVAQAAQKQIQVARSTQDAAAAAKAVEQTRTELLAEYDHNHNGVFDPDEKKAMIDDPRYLALELPVIDANTNGLLDAAELGFFDVNGDGILDPQEQKAIDITLNLLAEKLIAGLNLGANDTIDPAELPQELVQAFGLIHLSLEDTVGLQSNDRTKNKEALVHMLRTYLIRSLRAGSPPAVPRVFLGSDFASDAYLKTRVEAYWKFSRGQTNLPASPLLPKP